MCFQGGGPAVGRLWPGDGAHQPTDGRLQSFPDQRGVSALHQRVGAFSFWKPRLFLQRFLHACSLTSQMFHSQLRRGRGVAVQQTPEPFKRSSDGNVELWGVSCVLFESFYSFVFLDSHSGLCVPSRALWPLTFSPWSKCSERPDGGSISWATALEDLWQTKRPR